MCGSLTGYKRVETRDAKCPAMHRTEPHREELAGLQIKMPKVTFPLSTPAARIGMAAGEE